MWNDGEVCGYLDQRRRVTADATSTRDIESKTSSLVYRGFGVILTVLLTETKDRGRKRERKRGSFASKRARSTRASSYLTQARKFRGSCTEETSL